MSTTTADTVPASVVRSGKYLAFYLDVDEYAIPVSLVREIMGIQDIKPLPQTPDYVRGVINLRGRVVPVIDMRRKFGLPGIVYGPHACIIVVQARTGGAETPIGVVVDRVSEVLNLTSIDTEGILGLGVAQKFDLIGRAKLKGNVKILLDVHQLLPNSEIPALEGTKV
jgi:purine-binding chemotaxis protein CheW